VTDRDEVAAPVRVAAVENVFSRDDIGRVLLDAAARAVRQRGCGDLHHVPVLGRHGGVPEVPRRLALAAEAHADALSAEDAETLSTDAVAMWIVGQYPPASVPAVLLGSPHGAAVHLAAALGVPWLPSGFTVTVRWPGGSVGDWGAALDAGAVVSRRLVAANPGVSVRQVHDPVRRGSLCGSTLTLHVQWRSVPGPYLEFLRRLEPGGSALVLRDTRIWPALDLGGGHTFQIGSPVTGWDPDDYTADNPSFGRLLRGLGADVWADPLPNLPRRYAETAGDPELECGLRHGIADRPCSTHRVLYPDPAALSACVADVYREWLRDEGAGDRCVVEVDRLLDPWQVLTAGLVPYWCESASRRAVSDAEMWLAGSSPFDVVDVLPAPPGSACDAHALLGQWRAAASFARERGAVDVYALRRYPLLPLPTSHATHALPTPRRLRPAEPVRSATEVLAALRRAGEALGLLVL
jgi:hypothetical protein